MSYLSALLVMLIIIVVFVAVVWGVPMLRREKPTINSSAGPRKEQYGEPPGMIRAVHRDELGFRGWADTPGDYEGSSASALSGYVQRSA